MELTTQIIKKMLKLRDEEQYFNNLFSDPISDTIELSQNIGDERMNTTQHELYTIISLKDNPNLNLDVAQPNNYKTETTLFGNGILCYQKNALNILKSTLAPNEIIVRITVYITRETLLDLCGTKDKDYIKRVYNTITDKSKISTDEELINYVCKKGNREIDVIAFFTMLGSPIFDSSIITDYMDKAFLIKNTNIIVKAEQV